jgi:hypothetical protein
MKTRLKMFIVGMSGLVFATSVAAHQPAYSVGHGSGLSGSVTVWSGGPYGPGYSGSLNYGYGYSPAPVYYTQPAYYRGHHPKYARGYGPGYAQGYKHGHKHKRKHKRGGGHDRHH